MDQTAFPPLTVTRAAVGQIEMLGGSLLVDVEPGGCCGTTFVFSTVDGDAPGVAVRSTPRRGGNGRRAMGRTIAYDRYRHASAISRLPLAHVSKLS